MAIFIPNRINVGYQRRKDTYTGKLAYVIYYDERGKLRKETSWQNWRDKTIPNNEYDNVPTEGFVLNKKVGGYKSDWNFRQTYSRIYDPRGFEFEITVENLLWILENCNCIKGKGLEGEFVYGYDGKELILIPVDSPDYKNIVNLSNTIKSGEFVKGSELKVGAAYKDRNNAEYIYLGRYNYYEEKSNHLRWKYPYSWYNNSRNESIWAYPLDDTWGVDIVRSPKTIRYKYEDKGKVYWFAQVLYERNTHEAYFKFLRSKNISKRFMETDIMTHDEFQKAYEEMAHLKEFSPIDFSRQEIIYVPFNDFEKYYKETEKTCYGFGFSHWDKDKGLGSYFVHQSLDEKIFSCQDKNFDSLKEVYDEYKPCIVKQYLKNNNYVIRGYNYGNEK